LFSDEAITYTNWRAVESVGYQEMCVVMVPSDIYKGEWELVHCDHSYAYICEFKI